MKRYIVLAILLLSVIGYAQNGINYKAVIKDTDGNVLTNQSIDIIFSIQHESVSIYSESQQIVTNNNGIAIATIGNGTAIIGTFDTIDWKLINLELNVQIDIGDGLIDFGNSPFNAVPYAINTLKPQGLEALDQGNGTGYRIVSVADADNYGIIGGQAIDFSFQGFSSNRGATGLFSFASGAATLANASYSVSFGQASSSTGEAAFSSGSYTIASGSNSTAMGLSAEASGNNSIALGRSTIAEALNSTALGRYNVGGGNQTTWIESDPLFEIGNGSSSSRSNALTILKNGQHTINSTGAGLIIRDAINAIIISESQANSIDITNSGFMGIRINGTVSNGISISNAQLSGISSSGNIRGGFFSGGDVGVHTSTTNPGNPDIILGGNSSANANDDGIIASDPFYSSSDIFLVSNDAIVLKLDDDNNESGNLFIRNGANTNVFSVNESGNVSVNGSVVHSSDKRLKTNIENLDYGLKEILKLQPKQYLWKDQQNHKKSIGLIAQDVESVINEIVTSKDDELKTLGVSYTELIPVLINAIKEQQKIIDNEKSINTKQNTQLEALLSRVEQLESKSSN